MFCVYKTVYIHNGRGIDFVTIYRQCEKYAETTARKYACGVNCSGIFTISFEKRKKFLQFG